MPAFGAGAITIIPQTGGASQTQPAAPSSVK
jgi:hypothetical protein